MQSKAKQKNRSVTETPKTSDSSSSSTSSDSSSPKEQRKSAEDPVKKANENYQEDVVYGQQAGFGIGSFGSAKADATIKDNTTVAEQMKLRLSGGEDIRGENGNVVDGYSQGMYENRYDMLDQNSATMGIQQGVASQVSFADGPV